MELKKVQDYYEQLFELYPDVPKRDIKRIMQYGLKAFLMHNNYGADVLIQGPNIWMYSGQLTKDSLKYFNYYKRNMITKLRILTKRLRIPWDGYYYFGLTKNQYQAYLEQKNKKGRPKKYFNYGNQVLYKLFDECNLKNSERVAFFRITFHTDLGPSLYKPDFQTGDAELILLRDPLTFKDILISNYKYQYLEDYHKRKKKNDNG